MEYLRDESGWEQSSLAGLSPSRPSVPQAARGAAGFRHKETVWTYLVMQLAAAWAGVAALLIPGALLWGRVVPSEGQIAYIARRSEWAEIRVMDMRTRIIHPVISLMGLDQIAWSANGAFAFTVRHGENSRIAAIDLPGRDMRQLTYDFGFDTTPAWSPDGRWLAFQSSSEVGTDLYVIDSDGKNLRQLTSGPGLDGDPTWSPDGKQIAFRSSVGGNRDLYVMNADGSNVRQLTDNQAREEHPAWSPDGKYIAFASYELTNWDLYLLEVATGEIRQLTESPARDHHPTWSPDSARIAFESNRDGQMGIYILDLDEGRVTLVAGDPQGSYFPIWRP